MAKKLKSTLDKPESSQAVEFEKDYKKTMASHGLNKLMEVDSVLSEEEQSLKKKIFKLSKMEALVHNDPKLSAVYEKMAKDGDEKYGYHYNETIMNILFNDYVLNSPKYLQKYKMSMPKEKKRRDKSGANIYKKDKTDKKSLEKKEDEIDETTTASSSGAYATPFAWSGSDKPKKGAFYKGGDVVNENVNVNIIKESNYLINSDGYKKFYKSLISESVEGKITNLKDLGRKVTKKDIPNLAGQALYDVAIIIANKFLPLTWNDLPDVNSMWDYIDENGGMTYEDLVDNVKDAVNERLSDGGFELDDLMENEKMNEDHKVTKEDKIEFIVNVLNSKEGVKINKEILMKLSDAAIDQTYNDVERLAGINEKASSISQQQAAGIALAAKKGKKDVDELKGAAKEMYDNMSNKELEDFAKTKHGNLPKNVDEHHLNNKTDKIDFILMAFDILERKETSNSENTDQFKTMLNRLDDEKINRLYLNVENKIKKMGIDPKSIKINEPVSEESMIDNNDTSMKMKDPINPGGGVTSGMESSVNEDRKTSSMINKERLGTKNKQNFKSDLSNSRTKEIIDVSKEMEYKDQQTTLDDPKKLYKEIEKEELKNTQGKSFKNVGNSTNNKGDEIPKRNLTDEEENEVDLYRKGLGDYVYDNKPDERFEERMKRDMGEKLYNLRQKKMEFNAKAPMYNKDSQPVDDGIEKVQYDKEKTKWNDRMGIKEDVSVTGVYDDEFNKRKIVDFNLRNVTEEIENVNNLHELDLNGLGNLYSNKLNENMKKVLNENKFYTDGKNVYVKSKDKNTNKKDNKINEGLNKFKHLSGYNPHDFIDTKKSIII